MDFVSLHSHSTFSYLDGYGMPEDHVAKVADLGMGAVALTEHGNVSSHVKLERSARAAGVKPIFGCELYTGFIDEERKSQRKNHMGVLAMDQNGYQNLLRVVSRAYSEGFYYQPTVSGQMLAEQGDGLILLSGCTASLLATSLIGGKNIEPKDASFERALKVAAQYKEVFGDRYYLEVQVFHELDAVKSINQALEIISNKLDIPLVATADVHFCEPSDAEIRKILHAVRAGGKFVSSIEQEFDYNIPAEYPHNDQWVVDRLVASGLSEKAAQEALRNTGVIASRCDVELKPIDNLRFPLPQGHADPVSLYRDWVRQGWKKRGFDKLPPRERQMYKERVQYESELIEAKGFTDYFLVMSDTTRYAKRSGIPVGPARGSAAASLICYLLEITEVNPMKFSNMLFERFIDLNRHDLPDIDLDFDDDRRHEVREYLVEKYGAERVGNIGTFTAYKGKNSIDDVARVYGIPKYEVETLKNLLIERSSGDLRASATIEDTAEMFEEAAEVIEKYPKLLEAMRLEGNLRGMSIHAAGLVVANKPLTDTCAVYERTNGKGETVDVVSIDKYDAEYLNVLKLDILGLKTMGMIRICLEEVGMSLDELYNIPLDDARTLKGFQDGDVVGVFQFDGRAMRNVNESVVPDDFDQVCDINALARPGPLHGGATGFYIRVKRGAIEPRSFGPIVDEITKPTYGQVVYQEQILRIVREVGNFTWEEAARIRKIISKKRGEQEFNRQKGKFVQEAPKNGLSKYEAEALWSMIVTAGAYAFNRAHCVSYGLLAWWTMWLKQNHPVEFYTACLRKYDDKQEELLRDASLHGIKVLPPDFAESGITWKATPRGLLAGWTQLYGVGPKTAQRIMDYQDEHGVFENWDDLLNVKGIGPKTLQKILAFTAKDDPFDIWLVRDRIEKVRKWIEDEGHEKYGIPIPKDTTETVPYEQGDNTPVTWMGVVTQKNLKDLYENHFSKKGVALDPETVERPDLSEWVVMEGKDQYGTLVVTLDRFLYPQFRDVVWSIEDNYHVIIADGYKPGFHSRKAVYFEKLWVIDPEND